MTNNTKILLGAAAALALVAGGTAMALGGHHGARGIAEVDLNHDGQVAIAEVNKAAAQRFAAFDVDKNGRLTGAELLLLAGDRDGGRQGIRPPASVSKPQAPSPQVEGQGPQGLASGPSRMLPNDFDADGAISLQEYSRGMSTRYMLMDINGDGIVSAAELEAAPRGDHGRRRHEGGEHRGDRR